MAEVVLLIEAYQFWIYAGLGLAALVYLRLLWNWAQELRKAMYGLERERARSGLRRTGAMLVLIVAGMLATFVAATFVSPALPGSARPTALPTVSLLATESPGAPDGSEASQFSAATELPVGTPDGAGCENPQATLTAPESGETVQGVIDVQGTANIENFAFYRYEYRAVGSQGVWQAVSAGTDPIVEGQLGTWDTSLVPSGEYEFRIVVTDTAGNAPQPCVIQVRVVPPPE
jgi:hypothetical protein